MISADTEERTRQEWLALTATFRNQFIHWVTARSHLSQVIERNSGQYYQSPLFDRRDVRRFIR
jgi:hypothetical protein